MTLNDLERPIHTRVEKMRLLESTAQIWIKMDPHCQRQQESPANAKVSARQPWYIQGAANKSNPLPCFVNISTTNRNFYKKIYTDIPHSYIRKNAKLC